MLKDSLARNSVLIMLSTVGTSGLGYLYWMVAARELPRPAIGTATALISAYLADERELGRIAADGDVDALAVSLVGAGHLLFTSDERLDPATVGRVVASVIADVLQRRLL